MGRWQPPSPASSPYITPEGYRRLEAEFNRFRERRNEVTRALAAAAAEGDRSENAEYIYRKKELREIDRRIRYLQKRLPELNIVNEVGDMNRIFFGAYVTVESMSGELSTFRIVGADEIAHEEAYISIDSPMGKALLGKSADDEITVEGKAGEIRYIITTVKYDR